MKLSNILWVLVFMMALIADERIQVLGEEKQCYDELGCLINNASWFHVIHRPINFFPMSRSQISTQFTLLTRRAPTTPGPLLSVSDTSTIKKSTFNSTIPTKFIIHGYMATGYEDNFATMAANLLQYGNYNVITVHWGGGAFVNYVQATANIRLVALEIALLIQTLQINFGLKPADVHIIGHSLGAHTAGYVGQKISKLGRITGLDPAGPLFRGMPNLVRLDSSDAQFVDAIHSDGKGFGLMDDSSHVGFFPNGGERQPACSITSFLYNTVNSLLSLTEKTFKPPCNHDRAISLFNDALLAKSCQSVGYQCDSIDAFNQGDCTSCGGNNTKCASLGMKAVNYPSRSLSGVRLFFNTAGQAAFCQFHYAITVTLAKNPLARSVVNGILKMSLYGSTGTITDANLIDKILGENLVHGESKTFLYTDTTNIGVLKSINLDWKYVQNPLNPSTLCVLWCNKNLYVSSVQVAVMNNGLDRKDITHKSCLSADSSNDISIPSGTTSSSFKVISCL